MNAKRHYLDLKGRPPENSIEEHKMKLNMGLEELDRDLEMKQQRLLQKQNMSIEVLSGNTTPQLQLTKQISNHNNPIIPTHLAAISAANQYVENPF